MRLYGTEGGFARREGAPAWRGEVCLFAPAELEAAHLPACVRLLLPAQARYCRAGTEGAALVGAVKRSAGNFTFALWEGNLGRGRNPCRRLRRGRLGGAVAPGDGACWTASSGGHDGGRGARRWRRCCPGDRTLARAEKLETEALTEAALTSNRFGGKLLGVRKQVSALARYCAQLEDMFEDLGDARPPSPPPRRVPSPSAASAPTGCARTRSACANICCRSGSCIRRRSASGKTRS